MKFVSSKHIIVIRLSAMGDVAMTVPVLRAMVQQHPELKITMVSKAFLKPMFDDLPNVNFYTADIKGKHKGVLGLYRLYKELKDLKPDAIADLHNVLRSKILRFFFSLKRINTAIIDKGRAEKKALTSTKNKVFKQLKTSHERYADVFRKLGVVLDLSKPKFPKKAKLSDKTYQIIGIDHLKWIGIAPFAQHDSKMYPLDLMQEVISVLSQTNQYKILLFGGGEKEVKTLKKIEILYKNTISVAGKLNFTEELQVISNLDLMLSMDSANAHLAAMKGIKTITLWGATHPFAGFSAFNQPTKNQILPDLEKYPKIPCSIYGNKTCEGYQDVMRSIFPETVVEKIINIVADV